MNNKILVRFSEEDIPYEEKLELLISGNCISIFPLSILHTENQIIGYYDVSGYKRLSQCDRLGQEILISLLDKVMLAIENCFQYLIFYDEYVLNTSTIYVDSDFKNIRLTFVPDCNKVSIYKKIKDILIGLQDVATEDGKVFLSVLYKRMSAENLSFLGARRLINMIMDEINTTS